MAEVPDDLQSRIAGIIVERLFLDVKPGDIEPGESLTAKYGVDSVRLFDMVVGMEDDFDITFEDDELKVERFDSLERIANEVKAKLEAAD
jgi:acyl carrier protein